MKTLCVVLAAALLAGCSPSCEERGGELKFSHFQPIRISNVTHLQPIYRCELPEGKQDG